MSAAHLPETADSRDMSKIIAYMALGVSVVAVVLLGFYVYRSTRPLPVIKELQEAQAATAADVRQIEEKVKDASISIAAIEDTIRSDRQSALVLDLKRSLIVLQEVGKKAPQSLQPKISDIEKQLNDLTEEVSKPSPKKRLKIRSIR